MGALAGIAMSAAARRAEGDSIAPLQHVLFLGIGRLAVDPEFAWRAVLAAFDAEGREDRAFGKEGYDDRRIAAAFDQDLLPQSATMATSTTGVGAQALVMETQWRDLLADLD